MELGRLQSLHAPRATQFLNQHKFKILAAVFLASGGGAAGNLLAQDVHTKNHSLMIEAAQDTPEPAEIDAVQPVEDTAEMAQPQLMAAIQIAESIDPNPTEDGEDYLKLHEASGEEVSYDVSYFGDMKNRDRKSIILGHATWQVWKNQEDYIINEFKNSGDDINTFANVWFQTEEFRSAFKNMHSKGETDGRSWRKLCVDNYNTPMENLNAEKGSYHRNNALDIFAWCTTYDNDQPTMNTGDSNQ